MNIEIHKLSLELLDDYIYFFEKVVDNSCYCTGWSSSNDSGKDFSLASSRKNNAVESIKKDKLQGYLAYYDNSIIGWCNVNDRNDCIQCEGWQGCLNQMNIDKSDENKKIKSIFCFSIKPSMRNKGIATQLLKQICIDAYNDNYDFIEAYPDKEYNELFQDFMGPTNLYLKSGFEIFEETEEKIVVRKYLK